jgi:hypothetical protein
MGPCEGLLESAGQVLSGRFEGFEFGERTPPPFPW